MKTKSYTLNLVNKRMISVAIGLSSGILLLLTGGCQKTEKPRPADATSTTRALNAQEQILVGSWDLKQKETYEVSGIDSAGHCSCSLISTAPGDSSCKITFFSSIMGAGTIGGCDANAGFSWNVPQQNKLQTNNALFTIEYICKDSMALSTIYTKDILELKDLFYYRKK